MPITVDGAQRRSDVVREAATQILAGGVSALSFRTLAKALGCSTTVISHYFRNKDDVLAETFRHAVSQTMARRDEALAETGGDLLVAMEALLPASEAQRRCWIVWLSFWNAALFDDALQEEHRTGLAATRERLRDYLADQECDDPDEAAVAISAALLGVSVQALFDPAFWTPKRQIDSFRRAVRDTLARPSCAAS